MCSFTLQNILPSRPSRNNRKCDWLYVIFRWSRRCRVVANSRFSWRSQGLWGCSSLLSVSLFRRWSRFSLLSSAGIGESGVGITPHQSPNSERIRFHSGSHKLLSYRYGFVVESKFIGRHTIFLLSPITRPSTHLWRSIVTLSAFVQFIPLLPQVKCIVAFLRLFSSVSDELNFDLCTL